MIEELLFGLKFTGYSLLTTALLGFVGGYLYQEYRGGDE